MNVLDAFARKGPMPKPQRGSGLIERAHRKAQSKAEERAAIAEAKIRDGYRCRWPESHVCRGGLEGAHIQDKSLCGPNVVENIVSVCAWIHRRGPESIHGKQLKVEKESPLGADGALSFWRQDGGFDALGQPTYACVARERTPGIVERD